MQIQVTSVGQPYKDGKFSKFELHYVRDGKPSKRVMVNVSGPSQKVFDALQKAKAGENYEIELVKDGDFWNWVGVNKVLADYPVSPPIANSTVGTSIRPAAKTTNTYETPEERARRQVLIVRQSSLANSIAFLSREKPDVTATLKVAQQFVDFVNQTTGELVDDIPF